ncbi:C2H2-type zinc finger protein [Aspergillus mulundensis]|uniref:C2H2-type domain-containing protein n=1 Tax=Aspergillus mulundensis TaxID=1810919 RepID=A0A3D8RRU2_9EURO|nr:hypothetical protein DSM5745_06513 [Aspergillus mulundensis]RDW76521.1 hypothetical protein DSM5745_06513 [Aspergillus mulundensis]
MPPSPAASKWAARQEELTCKVCSRTFSRHEHLQRHSRTHTKEKPYACFCGRSFSRKDLLTRHERLNHATAEGENNPAPRNQNLTAGAVQAEAIPQSVERGLTHSDDPQPQSTLYTAPGAESYLLDPFLLSSTDGLFPECDDPMFGFTRYLSNGDLGFDWNGIFMNTDLGLQNSNPPDYQTVDQIVPERADISSRVPDASSGDDDFRELKPLSCPWLLSEAQYLQLNHALSPFHLINPRFILPSRMAVARYTLGYVQGFSDHHPVIHIPTLRLTNYSHSPELVLALLAIGAQYRYETKTARSLYQAGRAIIRERLQRGELFPPPTSGPQFVDASSPASKHYMDRTRALLLLAIYCSWHMDPDLTQEFTEYQGLVARSLRHDCLSERGDYDRTNWFQWAAYETDRRTKFFGWCLLNFRSLAYNEPPLLLVREIDLFLPCSCREWVAKTEADWLLATRNAPSAVMFKAAHMSHLDRTASPVTQVSPFGNYVLIHALIQRIYMTHEVSHDPNGQIISPGYINELEQSLDDYRHTWCRSPESILDLHNSYDSLSFASTALLGLAHIRLHCNLGRWRDLQSGDPRTVAAMLQEAPLPQRGPQLFHALLHSVHSLNIPVQVGISYLSRCRSFSWSVDQAICALESAAFLSKWLQRVSLSHSNPPLSGLEHRVVRWIMRVVREALMSQDETIDFGNNINDSQLENPAETTKLLSYAVVKVWANMFKSCNCPWPMVEFVGQSLDQYAVLVRSSPYEA